MEFNPFPTFLPILQHWEGEPKNNFHALSSCSSRINKFPSLQLNWNKILHAHAHTSLILTSCCEYYPLNAKKKKGFIVGSLKPPFPLKELLGQPSLRRWKWHKVWVLLIKQAFMDSEHLKAFKRKPSFPAVSNRMQLNQK